MTQPSPDRTIRRRTRRRAAALLLGCASFIGLAVFSAYMVWANTYPRGPLFDPIANLPDPLPAADAELNARRAVVGFADAQEMWRRYVERELGRPYQPARLEIFTRVTQSSCAPGRDTAGPIYCAAEATVAYDLLFSEALSRRLRREAELGISLIAARLAGAHVLRQLGRTSTVPVPESAREEALAADCLVGVWANVRGSDLGSVEVGVYGRIMQTARNTATSLAQEGPRITPGLDPFREGRIAEREAAFQAGYRTGEPAVCAVAGTIGASG